MVGGACPEGFRVLPSPQGGDDPRSPAPVSTRLYPEAAFVVVGDVDEHFVKQVTQELLAIAPGSDVAIAATVAGFTAPLNYTPVRELMEELRIGPFESFGHLTFAEALRQHLGKVAAALLCFLLILSLALFRSQRLNKQLELSEGFRKRVFESSHLPIVVMDATTLKYIDCNPAATAIYRFRSRADTLGKTLRDVSAPVQYDGQPSDELIRRYVERAMTEVLACFEWRHQRPDGEIWDAEVHLMGFRLGERPLMQFTLEDISEHKKSEEARLLLTTAAEQAAETIVIKDPEGTILYANPAIERVTGYSRQEAIGQNPRILKSGKHDNAFYRQMWETISRGEVWSNRIINKKKNGDLYKEEISVSPVRDAAGKIVNYVGVKRDVTQEAALEAQLRQAQKMEAVGHLAGGIAHDFNNLLTVINGYADFLLKDLPPDDSRRSDLNQIKKAGQRAAVMTAQLLAFSRKQILRPEILDLNKSVTDLCEMLRRLIGEDIKLVTILQPSLGRIKADPGQIQQVIMNIAINARDAMSQGGKLAIETADADLDEDFVRTHIGARVGRHVMLAVRDNGVGMDTETRSRIFEPFFTTKAIGKGTGLGLSTVYGIVKQGDGYISVESELGRGTEFRIYFPCTDGEADRLSWLVKEEQRLQGAATVLIIEDEPSVRGVAARVLRERGYTVLEASGGAEAMRAMQEFVGEIHLVLADVVMPGMNGREIVSQIAVARPGIKALFVSGYAGDAIAHHGVLDSDVTLLKKPFTADDLLGKVREVLGLDSPPSRTSGESRGLP